MFPFSIHNAMLQDLPEIVAIYNGTIPDRIVTADLEPVTIEDKLSWFHQHNPEKRPLWTAKNERGLIVGWVSFQDFYGRPAYAATAEISIYLHAAQRGKGIGRELLRYSLNNCISLGIKTLLGYIFAHNEPSLRLFRHFGFEEWGSLPNIALLDGKERTVKILGKRVT